MPNYTWVPAGFDTMVVPKKIGIKKTPIKLGEFKMSPDEKSVQLENKIITVDKHKFDKCDRVLTAGKWNAESLKQENLRIVMYNSATAHVKFQARDHGVDVLTDSGGYQLKTGVKKFLDPRDIAARHNEIGTIGISLDLPVTPAEQTILLPRLTRMQRRNNEIFKTDLKISGMNVSHGFNLTNREQYLDGVWDPHFDRLAVAGLIGKPPIDIVAHLAWLIDRYGKQIKHYHFLGISGYGIFFTLSYLAKVFGPDVLISSDSSTYLMHAKSALMFDPLRYSGSMDVSPNRILLSNSTRIPCTCKYCRDVEFLKATVSGPKGLLRWMMHHNMREATRRVHAINDMVDTLSLSEIEAVVKKINANKADEINRALRFAYKLSEANPKERRVLLRPWLRGNTLFQSKAKVDTSALSSKHGKRFVQILDTYDKFHDEMGIK